MITGNMLKGLNKFRFSTSYNELVASSKISRVQQFTNLKQLLDGVYAVKPAMHCIIFNQVGHPYYEQVNQQYADVANKFVGYKFYTINIDSQDKVAQFYGIKHLPTSIIYGLGQPLARHVGLGQEKLEKKLEIATTMIHTTDFLSGTEQWEGPQDLWRAIYEEDQQQFDYFAR